MSLGDWIRSLFGGARKRDISRLSPTAAGSTATDSDAIVERVDISGGPLREHHRRLALRDPRLLPKVKSPARALGFTKKKKIMEVPEAERLFGGTMRTRNRSLRDLRTDPEQ
ncbi:MAG TPA: hypothetical protein VNH84_16470, partial [Candidatus Saccharimonadales bacterium]|nr:hypothetical protein [Candidatus Saccharimonadales bacterium]